MRVRLPGGIEALATVRALPNRMGRLALIQPVWDATRIWRERALSLSLLGARLDPRHRSARVAFFQQSARAAEADVVCAQVRSRIDSVLGSGRSGLWDWDIARGRIFVSDSFYALLGRERADDFLSFADIRDWVHPDDEAPFGGSDAGPADGRIEREFRMLHAEGRWIWICIRGCLTTDQPAHLVGIAVDITDEKAEAEVRATADVRLRDAIESISEAFALFDDQEMLVLANSRYQRLLALPPHLMRPGTPLSQLPARATATASSMSARSANARSRAAAVTRSGSPAAAGSRSTSAPPRTAAMSRSAPTSRPTRPMRNRSRRANGCSSARSRIWSAPRPRYSARRSSLRSWPKATSKRRRGRERQPRQGRVPRQHEPRAAHAAQPHHRLLRHDAERHLRPARQRALRRLRPGHRRERPVPARRHQRHPRHVEPRGGRVRLERRQVSLTEVIEEEADGLRQTAAARNIALEIDTAARSM